MKKSILIGVLFLGVTGIKTADDSGSAAPIPNFDTYADTAPTPDSTDTPAATPDTTDPTSATPDTDSTDAPAPKTDDATTPTPDASKATSDSPATPDSTDTTPATDAPEGTAPTPDNTDATIEPVDTLDATAEPIDAVNPADEHNAPTMVGGWGGLSPDARDSIKASDEWKKLVNSKQGTTDAERYTLWLDATGRSTVDATDGISSLNEKMKADIDMAVKQALKEQLPAALKATLSEKLDPDKKDEDPTPDELFAEMMQELDPKMSGVEFEAKMEEFEETLGEFAKDLEQSQSGAPDMVNTISVAPNKDADKDAAAPAA